MLCGHLCNLVSLSTPVYCVSVTVALQARDVRNNEVVAIKKMSYSGKQTNEVTNQISS